MKRALLILVVLPWLGWALPASAMRIKIATIAPEGTNWMTQFRLGAEEVARRTQNRVTIKFYPGGVMGSDKSVLRKIRIGQLHGAAFTSGGLASVYKDTQIYNVPFIFDSYEELDYVRERMDPVILEGLEKNGFIAFGIAEGGFSYLMTRKPVHRITDLKTEKVWAPQGDEIVRTFLGLYDITPIPLPLSDVLPGLQTGLITAIGATPSFAIALQWHTRVKYLTDLPLLYTYGVFVIAKKTFSRLKDEDQAVLREVFGAVFKKLNRTNRTDNIEAKAVLRKQGIEFVKLAQQDVDSLRRASREVAQALTKKGVYSRSILDRLSKHISAYRASTATAKK